MFDQRSITYQTGMHTRGFRVGHKRPKNDRKFRVRRTSPKTRANKNTQGQKSKLYHKTLGMWSVKKSSHVNFINGPFCDVMCDITLKYKIIFRPANLNTISSFLSCTNIISIFNYFHLFY